MALPQLPGVRSLILVGEGRSLDCRISFSGETFERLIRYRIVEGFRPLTTPVDFPVGAKSWLDGIVVTQVVLNRIRNHRTRRQGQVQPACPRLPGNRYNYRSRRFSPWRLRD